ncbi:Charged multivesicular body protein 6 [Bonamia ostreae]|uniref:Charged multivesicular body protein 6 n=1 Tax=Bonamia ostreae TaxID=126728 RepID=A0ABV2AV41_9EUKA
MESVMKEEDETVRKLLKEGHRSKATFILRKKRFQQNLLDGTDSKLLNIHKLLESIESSALNKEIVSSLKDGKKALDQINKELDVDKVMLLLDESEEAIAYQKEIDNLLNKKLNDEDDEAVREELEQLINSDKREVLERKEPLSLRKKESERRSVEVVEIERIESNLITV